VHGSSSPVSKLYDVDRTDDEQDERQAHVDHQCDGTRTTDVLSKQQHVAHRWKRIRDGRWITTRLLASVARAGSDAAFEWQREASLVKAPLDSLVEWERERFNQQISHRRYVFFRIPFFLLPKD